LALISYFFPENFAFVVHFSALNKNKKQLACHFLFCELKHFDYLENI